VCGICGKLVFDGATPDPTVIRAMAATLSHRGPDAVGVHTEAHVGLGQTRLAIIDLRAESNPPLMNDDGTIWIVLNGEIYNYVELRAELQAAGARFRTDSDTEVLLRLYEARGIDCLQALRGMFAFAIWDARRGLLFAARDRLGKKPFCYTRDARRFVFGSEIKAITADPSVQAEPDLAAIDQYLTWQYVPSPATAFAGIRKLPPGHYLTCTRSGDLRVEHYWRLPDARTSAAPEAQIAEELEALLRESVRLRLRADVPVGVMLSGGIDSGMVTALTAQATAAPVSTFSVGFEEESHDELPYARMVAQRYGTRHHEIVLRPQLVDVLPRLVRHYNEPFADSSAIPTYYVCQALREEVTVALSGDGGDESFAGYGRYADVLAWSRLDALPLPLRRSLAVPVQGVAGMLPYSNRTARMSRGLRMVGGTTAERYLQQVSIMKDEERRECYTPFFLEASGRGAFDRLRPIAEVEGAAGALDWMMRYDLKTYLPDCLMVKTDIASMANSLEVRSPLLDHRVVEFASCLPSHLKLRDGVGKWILKQVAAKLLPEAVVAKPKSGFGIPLAHWLRGPLQPLVRDTLLGEAFARRGLFRQPFVRRMVDEHFAGTRDWSNRLWSLVFLELWYREFSL
jgi:asparagine synthase (glutamine-hydrolysing)